LIDNPPCAVSAVVQKVGPNVDGPAHLQALTDAAKARGVALSVFPARTLEEIVPALDAARSSGAGAINVLATQLFFFNRQTVIARANCACPQSISGPKWPNKAA
jgi:hypothetical protein